MMSYSYTLGIITAGASDMYFELRNF